MSGSGARFPPPDRAITALSACLLRGIWILKVLVIEDNPEDAHLIERALRGHAQVEHADSGAEGIRKATSSAFDLVILDYRLGDLTGTEVMVRLHEKSKSLPVIITSGMGSHFIVARTLALGAREFVNKDEPDFPRKILAAVQHVTAQPAAPLGPANQSTLGTGGASARADEIKRMITSILEESDLVNTVGIVGADGALIHGHIKDKSGAEDVTAVLAGTVQMMLSTVAGHLGYGGNKSIVASYEKGAIAMAPLPGNLAIYFTSNAPPSKADALRAEIEAAAGELGILIQTRKAKAEPR